MKQKVKKVLSWLLFLFVFPFTLIGFFLKGNSEKEEKREIKEEYDIIHTQHPYSVRDKNIFETSITTTATAVTGFLDKYI